MICEHAFLQTQQFLKLYSTTEKSDKRNIWLQDFCENRKEERVPSVLLLMKKVITSMW